MVLKMEWTFGMRPKARIIASSLAAIILSVLLATRAGALSITSKGISFPDTTLTGIDQIIEGNTTAWQVDAQGEDNGWQVVVSSSDFVSGESNTIPVTNFKIRLLDSNITWLSGDIVGPSSTQATFIPLNDTGVKIASAAIGNGNGEYTLLPNFQLTIPAETMIGIYTATLVVSANSGP
jgi:hypothetical protein